MASEKGLGKGLSALLGDTTLETQSNGSVFLPISQVEPGLNQPRRRFDEDALADLADSISTHGVIQPLTVRRLSSGYYQIIAGERRWRAARMAGLSEIPALIVEADDRKVMEIGLVENLQREDLSPIEEAMGYRRLIEEFGLTQEEAAVQVGKSRPAVANAMRLLALPPRVQELVANGELSSGHGRAILSLPDLELQDALAEQVIKQGLSVRETELLAKKMTREIQKEKKSPLPFDHLSLYLREAEKNLAEQLGRKVHISYRGKKGKIELEYYDERDLESLLQLLNQRGKEE